MNLKIFLCCSLLSFSLRNNFAQSFYFNNQLTDLDKKTFTFSELKNEIGSVVVFLLSDCPASQDYMRTLNQLSQKYRKNKISFVGIFPGTYTSDSELTAFRKMYKPLFPLLKDTAMNFTKSLSAKIVPSCFLFNQKGEIIYKGRIDDWLYSLGKKRTKITQRNLEDAIICLLKNQPVKTPETVPIGCILEYDY